MHARPTYRAGTVYAAIGAMLLGSLLAVPTTRADDGDAVVIVNGRPISKHKLVDVLTDAYGLQVMQQLIVLELAKAETRRLEIRVSAADVDAEFARALSNIAPQSGAAGQALTEDEQRRALAYLLQEKNISHAEFMIGMERNAHLRKIVERDFRVDEATLREEFARAYGAKVAVRHIQLNTINGLHEALNLLDEGTDFAEVARRVSQNPDTAARGGLLEPFAFNADDAVMAPVLREAAFAMQPGEVSKPIKVGRWWHILRIERRITPADVRFEDLREQVERGMRARVLPERMNALITKLFQRAEIRVLDRKLRREYEELLSNRAPSAPSNGP